MPIARLAPTVDHAGSVAPDAHARPVLQAPASKPLTHATTIASFVDTFRVRLLSMAQQRQAPTMSKAPGESISPPGAQESKTPPATMATMPMTIWRSAFSLNTIQAMTAVNTPSTFRSNDAVAPDAWLRPHISKVGATTPPKTTAPSSHGTSLREMRIASAA